MDALLDFGGRALGKPMLGDQLGIVGGVGIMPTLVAAVAGQILLRRVCKAIGFDGKLVEIAPFRNFSISSSISRPLTIRSEPKVGSRSCSTCTRSRAGIAFV